MSNKISYKDKIFVAGARGMAGSAIHRALKKSGYGDLKKGGLILVPSREELDLLNYEDVENWFKKNKPDIVILAAAKVGGIYANNSKPADFLLENLKIQTNVIEIAWKQGVKRLLFLGSSCIYPKFATQPIEEEELLQGTLEPTNEWYAIAKISGIKLCHALRHQHGFDAICLMPTNLYGPGDNYHPTNSHVLPALIRRFYEATENSESSVTCWGSGSPLREFLHVDDLGEASVFALEKWDPDDKDAPQDKNNLPLIHLNVGTGVDLPIKHLSEKVAMVTGFKGKIIWDTSKPDGTPKKQLDTNRINSLGWHPKISLEEGLESTFRIFKQEVESQKIRFN